MRVRASCGEEKTNQREGKDVRAEENTSINGEYVGAEEERKETAAGRE